MDSAQPGDVHLLGLRRHLKRPIDPELGADEVVIILHPRDGVRRAVCDLRKARLDRIQQTSVLQLVRERAFGLGTITYATAGTSTLDALWEAVADPFEVHGEVTRAIGRYGPGSGV